MIPPPSEDDAKELTDCYKSLSVQVFNYAMALTAGERALAEDVVQDVFHATALRWAKIRDLSNEERLIRLRRIARNKVVDAYRRRQTARNKQPGLLAPGHSDWDSTHHAAMLRIAGSEFWSAVRRLPARQRVIAVMRYRDQMTVKAIATELGISVGTVSGDLKKAAEALRGAVDGYIGPG